MGYNNHIQKVDRADGGTISITFEISGDGRQYRSTSEYGLVSEQTEFIKKILDRLDRYYANKKIKIISSTKYSLLRYIISNGVYDDEDRKLLNECSAIYKKFKGDELTKALVKLLVIQT